MLRGRFVISSENIDRAKDTFALVKLRHFSKSRVPGWEAPSAGPYCSTGAGALVRNCYLYETGSVLRVQCTGCLAPIRC